MELGNLTEDMLVWTPLGEDGEVLLRHVPKDEMSRLSRQASKRTLIDGKVSEEFDSIEASRLLGRSAVRDWKNLTVGGKPFPYGPENCDLLMTKSYEFSNLVNGLCAQVRFFIERQKDEAKKNSSPGSNG